MQAVITVQARVVRALILREIKTRFGDHKLGYLWAILEPVIFVGIFVGLFTLIGRSGASGMPVAQFLLTGIAPFFLFRKTMQQTINAITSNKALLTFPQVTPFDLIISRAILEIATMSVVFVLLLIAFEAIGLTISIQDPLGVMAAIGLLAISGLSMGMIFAAIAPLFPSIKQIVSAVMGRPLFFSSGLFFTVEMLPPSAREPLLYNPILHMIEMLRSAFFIEFDSRYVDQNYAAGFTLCLLALGLVIQRALNKRVLHA